jgi:hypothetical protein
LRRADIIGYTLAELALALLFAFILISLHSRERLTKGVSGLESEVRDLNRQLIQAKQESDVLKRQVPAKGSVAKISLRSSAPPSCIEIGLTSEPLFTTVIRGRDSFDVNGSSFTLSELLARFNQDVSAARATGCFHSIKLMVSPTLGAADYDFALRKIEQNFYTKKLGLAR